MTVINKPIAVIGAGIIGVSLARALQKKGQDVILFDPEAPGSGASSGNAGYIASDEIIPLAHGQNLMSAPKMLLDPVAPLSIRWQEFLPLLPWFIKFTLACRPSVVTHGVKALATIQSRALETWTEVIRVEKLQELRRQNGALKIYETDKGFEDTRPERELMREFGIVLEELGPDEVRQMVPELSKNIRHGLFFPNGMHITDPFTLTSEIFRHFQRDGGLFVNEKVTSLEKNGKSIRVVVTEKSRHIVAAAALTAGHKSAALLKLFGLRVPLVAERGYHIMVDHKPLKFDKPIGSHERGFYITPMKGGLRLAGTVEFSRAEKDPPPNWKRADILKTHINELMPGITGKETSRWMGHRPTLPDFLPVLGKTPGFKNLFLSFGHHHIGLTLAAISAKIMSDVILTGKTPLDISPFDIKRFGN